MFEKIKIGIVLILIGIGIPSVTKFFYRNQYSLNIRIKKQDKLREAEVKTLNSIYDLSKLFEQAKPDIEKMIEKIPAETFTTFVDKKYLLKDLSKKIEDLLKQVDIPNAGWLEGVDKETGARTKEFYLGTEVTGVVYIPFNYFIGIGLIFFITGIGFVVLPLIGRKEQTP